MLNLRQQMRYCSHQVLAYTVSKCRAGTSGVGCSCWAMILAVSLHQQSPSGVTAGLSRFRAKQKALCKARRAVQQMLCPVGQNTAMIAHRAMGTCPHDLQVA